MIRPQSQTIDEILQSTSILKIPSYQRPFDWGKEELSEMLSDLKSNVRDGELFLGNFIFEEDKGKNVIMVVDGQQRLTTISLILIAIRQYAKELKDFRFAEEVHKKISISSAIRRTESPKFIPSQNIREVYLHICNYDWDSTFSNEINEVDVRKQGSKLRTLYNSIYSELIEFNLDELRDFTKALMDAYVITLYVSDDQDVFSIFERTNARGLDLNTADLFKNYLFSFNDDSVGNTWDTIAENSGSTLLKLIKYYWVSKNGYIQQSQLYRKIKSQFKGIKEVISFVDELKVFSEFYRIVNNVENQEKELKAWFESNQLFFLGNNETYLQQIVRSISALKLFRVTQPIPLVYSVLQSAKNCTVTDPKKITKILLAIENFSFINYVITGKTANEVERFYAKYSVEFSNSDNFQDTTDKFLFELKKKIASREEFISSFIDELTYDSSPKIYELLIYFFDRYNNYDFNKKNYRQGSNYFRIYIPELNYKKRNNNIEHFYPQNPSNPLTKDQKSIINQIGNLVVMSRHTNSILGNKSVGQKVDILKNDKSLFNNFSYIDALLDHFDHSGKWDFEVIEKRTNNLAEIAYDYLWKF